MEKWDAIEDSFRNCLHGNSAEEQSPLIQEERYYPY
jgi:hypothetical protein